MRPFLTALLALAALLSSNCGEKRLPPDLQSAYDAGVALEERGLARRAVAELERVRGGAPDHLPARVALARLYAALARFDLAEAELDYALGRDPNYAPAYAARGRSLYLQQREPEARRVLEDAASRFPDSDEVLQELGLLHARTGEPAEALATFGRLRTPRASLPYSVALPWGSALEAAGRAEEARAMYRAAINRAPERSAQAHADLGALLLREGKPDETDEAIALLEEALRRQPGEPDILRLAGAALLAAGRWDEARNVLQRAVHATPPASQPHAECAALLARAESQLPAAAAPGGAQNVVLVVIDTLRRDHVGAYGYPRGTTPHLDRLARDGVVVEDAVSQAPWTAASIATMFTGLYPSVHGLDGGVRWGVPRGAAGGALRFAVQKTLSPGQDTLAEAFRRNGFETAGFVSNTYVNSIFGLAQGFKTYHDEHGDYSTQVGGKRRGAETNRLVFDWLNARPREPFFLFVHYNDPHLPYDPPAPHGREWTGGYRGRLTAAGSGAAAERHGEPVTDLTPEDVAYLAGLYDGEIHYTDEQVGRLLDRLGSARLSRPILTVVTSDHGEEFLDHGSMSHGYTLYEEQLRVPLLFHQAGRLAPRRVAAPVGLVDLAPTILALAGVAETLPNSQGRDRSALLRGAAEAAPSWTFSEATYAEAQQALRRPAGLKLIVRPQGKGDLLFDLRADPREMHPLGAHGDSAALRQALAELSAANAVLHGRIRRGKPEGEIVLDDETEERLRSLGYIR